MDVPEGDSDLVPPPLLDGEAHPQSHDQDQDHGIAVNDMLSREARGIQSACARECSLDARTVYTVDVKRGTVAKVMETISLRPFILCTTYYSTCWCVCCDIVGDM
eukprot:5039662-Pyramimonas_sp.AAC.1